MTGFFQMHPRITDPNTGIILRNLLVSARIKPAILALTQTMYPYRVKEGETPSVVAYTYYGSIDYTWLVYFSNNMMDMYSQWPKTQFALDAYAALIYGSVPAALATIDHYKHPTDPSWPSITPESWSLMTTEEQGQFVPVNAYDWLNTKNEQKRLIQLIDRSDAPKIALELESLLND